MSWGVEIVLAVENDETSSIEVFDGHTYNLSPMWRKAGIFSVARDLDGRSCAEMVPILQTGLDDALADRAGYEALNPENGWGDYDGFIDMLTRLRDMTSYHHSGTLHWYG